MFLVMAIFERFLRARSSAAAASRTHRDVEAQMMFHGKLDYPSPKDELLQQKEEEMDVQRNGLHIVHSSYTLELLSLLGEPGTGGSSTPSMVGAVKKWQKYDPQKSRDTWRKLSNANSALETQLNLLRKLAEEHWDAYKCVISSYSMCKSEEWIGQASEPSQVQIVKALLGSRDAMLEIRCQMQQMGDAAGIPEDCFYDLPYNTGYQIFVLHLRKTRDENMKCTLSNICRYIL